MKRDRTSRIFCNGVSHVKEVGGYWEHFKFGGIATLWVTLIFITSVIHIVIPHFLPFVAENLTCSLGEKLMKIRGWTIEKNDV